MLPTRVALSRSSTFGWIGLGMMGQPMALNLYTRAAAVAKAQGNTAEPPSMVICEPHDGNAKAFVERVRNAPNGGDEAASRIKRVTSPLEVVQQASRVHTMLPSTPQVEAVYKGDNGLIAGVASLGADAISLTDSTKQVPWLLGKDAATTKLPAGGADTKTLFIDHTTLDPTASRQVAEYVHDTTNNTAFMVDGPVSGGVRGATDGTLTIMYGSASELASALATPLMQYMAREGGVVACGGSGTGVGVKVCNNLILAINQIGLAEGLVLARALGIDPLLMHGVINGSTGESWSSKVNSPLAGVPGSPGSRDFTNGFQTKLMLKDVRLALTCAEAYNVSLPLGGASGSLYDSVCEEGDGGMATKDLSVVYEWLKAKGDEGVPVTFKRD